MDIRKIIKAKLTKTKNNIISKLKSLLPPNLSKRKSKNKTPALECLPPQPVIETAQEAVPEPKKPKKKFILSFDGGGNKTLMSVVVLGKIEKIIKELDPEATLQSAFDLFAGTSAGGLNAMTLAGIEGSTWEDLKAISVQKSQTIFTSSKKPFYRVMSTKYSSNGITKVLDESFGSAIISQSHCNFLVMSFDTISLKPVMISNANEFRDLTFVQAGLATTAAPVYFNPLRIEHDSRTYNLIDGGIAANNPSLFAYKLARELYQDADEYHVLSLGSYKNPESFNNTEGTFSWIDVTKGYGLPIQKVYHVAQEETAIETMNAINDVRFLRIENQRGQYKDNFRVDSTTPHDTVRLMEIGSEIADEYENEIRKFLKERFETT